jgi:glycosyltransferase involved in cell wall biosynthesis
MLKVSIITISRNSEKTIENSIQSVLGQLYNNIEYIIIDGASTDNTINIINKYINRINYFISEQDKSLYDALNKGIKAATGDIIGILHSDDIYNDNNVIGDIVSFFKDQENIDLVYGNALFINDVNKPIRFYSSSSFKPIMFFFGFQPAHTATFIKTQIHKKYGLYDENYKIAGDYDLLLRFILKYKLQYRYINRTIVKMKIGGKSTSGIQSIFQLNSEIKKSLKNNNLFSNYILIYSKYLVKIWSFLFFK